MKKKIYEKPETQVFIIQTGIVMSSGNPIIPPAANAPIFDADLIADYGDDSYEGEDDANGKIENFHGLDLDH